MDLTTWLVIGVVTGSVGMGYFVYGKKQQLLVPMLAGIALCVYPYFTANLWVTILVGLALMALPFVLRY